MINATDKKTVSLLTANDLFFLCVYWSYILVCVMQVRQLQKLYKL